MIYHFNNVENRESDILSSSFRPVEFTPLNGHTNYKTNHNDKKLRFEISFSEKFETIKANQRTICGIVFPKKSTIVLGIYLIVFVSYLYIGALCFKFIELDKEKEDRSTFYQFRKEFLANHNCINDSSLEDFISKVQKLSSRGLNALQNASSRSNNWEFSNAVFFATSLVTTIGYGNDKPVTVTGKIFCIIFVIFGIPMMMILTSAVVERLFLLVDLSFSALFYKLKWRITEDKFREIQILASFIMLTIFFFLIPSLAFYKMEDPRWTLLDSLYFCVISLTTIGLGDLVPGDDLYPEKRNLSRILATVYLFTGLLATSFCIRAFHRHQKWNFGDKFIYLTTEPNKIEEYSISDSSTSSDQFTNRESLEQLQSFPVDITKPNRGKRIRYNSFS